MRTDTLRQEAGTRLASRQTRLLPELDLVRVQDVGLIRRSERIEAMGTIKWIDVMKESIGPGRKRYLGHTDKLMMAVIDFDDGPTSEADPPHSHPQEQVSYVVAGEIMVHIGDEATRLGPGDLFTVPPDVPHTIQLLTEHVRLVDAFTPLRDDFIRNGA